MKKSIKSIILIIVCLSLIFSSFFIGYYFSHGTLTFVDNKANNADDIHSIYYNYLSSESGKKFLVIKDEDQDEYEVVNNTCIDKDILFFDIDNDKVDECILNIQFEDGFEYAHIFDIENSQVKLVNDSELLRISRSNVRFRLIQVSTGEYRILKYIQDANKAIIATVYNYNGHKLVPYKSFYANIYKYDGYDGEYFLSYEVDFLKEDYESYYEYNGPNESYKVDEYDFYCQWDFYTSSCKTYVILPEIEEF